MFAAQVATGSLMAAKFDNGAMTHSAGVGMIALVCIFVACFAFSWGPLGWLVSAPLSCRSTLRLHACLAAPARPALQTW